MITIREKYYNILAVVIGALLTVLIVFQSGHFITTVSRAINIASIITLFVFVFVFYLLTIDFKRVIYDLKNKKIPKPSFAFVVFVFVEVLLLLSFIFNKNKSDNIASYINYILLFAICVLFVKTFKFNTFLKWYSNALTIICLVSIVFFIVSKIVGYSFTNLVHLHGTNIFSDYFLLYSDYSLSEAQGVFYNGPTRLQGPFWEPGVLGTMISVGLLFEVGFKEKKNYFKILLFIATLILTKSTGALIVAPLVILYGIFDFIEKKFSFDKKKRFIVYCIVILIAILAIATMILIFRNKFFDRGDSGSFFTRFYSSTYNLRIWIRSPIFGFGFKTAREMYDALAPSAITANTATPSLLMSSFGIIGILYTVLPILGLAFNNKFSSAKAVVLFIIFILILHQENNAALIAPSIFYAYLALGSLKFKWENTGNTYSWKRSESIFNIVNQSKRHNKEHTVEGIKDSKKKTKYVYPALCLIVTLVFSITTFASANIIGFYKEKDDLYNIAQVLTQKGSQKYDGALAELKGKISTNDWLSYYSLTAERTNNKGLIFSIGDTIIDDKYNVCYSEISISNKSSTFNSKSLSFLKFDRSLFDDNSIVLPRKLTDKIFGTHSDYSDIIGKEIAIRINDSLSVNKKIIGVYENHSNFDRFSNNVFIKNFDYVVFLSTSDILRINSISNRRYFLTLSSSYQSNYSLFYSSFDFGVKTLSFPNVEMNNNFYEELSLEQYINFSHQSIKIKNYILVVAIVASLSALFALIYCFYLDYKNERYKNLSFVCLAVFSLIGIISLILFNNRILIGSKFSVSFISNIWIWIATISLLASLIIAAYKYVPLAEQFIKKWFKGLLIKWKEKKKE